MERTHDQRRTSFPFDEKSADYKRAFRWVKIGTFRSLKTCGMAAGMG
jgi:hypothetical protein